MKARPSGSATVHRASTHSNSRRGEIQERLNTLHSAAQAVSTIRTYASGVRHFFSSGGKIPSSPDAVSAYLARYAGAHSVATLQNRLSAIHRAHVDAGFGSPVGDATVKRTMEGIRRTYGTAQRRVKALTKDDLLEVLALVDQQKPMKAARDRALLLVGFAGAFRRSELIALRIEDVTEFSHGIEVNLRRSKTDQIGEGRTIFIPEADGARCPVESLAYWLALYGASQGPLFPALNRHDQVVRAALSPQSVALIVKQAVGRSRGRMSADAFSGHSLRAGYVTTAAEVGLQPYQIRQVTGHRSDVSLAKYIRPVQKRKVPSLL
jgi:integrase